MCRRQTICRIVLALWMLLILPLVMAGCGGRGEEAVSSVVEDEVAHATDRADSGNQVDESKLPMLSPVTLASDEKLRVAATTNIVADIVAQVGQDRIDLTRLMPSGADPHSYVATPQSVRYLNEVHVIFLNGLGLEEPLLPILENLDRDVPFVVVNAGVEPIEFAAGDGADEGQESYGHDNTDPHTWFSVPNVQVWVKNIQETLSHLDPSNANAYAEAAAQYAETLDRLDAELRAKIEMIPPENRKLVTDHEALGYLADEYGIQIVGAVVPSFSTMGTPSARELAALQDQITVEEVRAIFVGSTVSAQTARQLAGDLGIAVAPLYTGSLSERDGPAPSYVDLMRYDVGAIVDALK